jgi:UDP-galactopyranose mutase
LYEKEAEKLQNVFFVGRLGTYKYYEMNQVIAAAFATLKRIIQ